MKSIRRTAGNVDPSASNTIVSLSSGCRILLMSRQDGITFRLADPKDALQLADLRWRLKTDDSSEFSMTERNDFVAAFAAFTESASGRQCVPFFHWVAELEGRLIAVMSV